MAWLESARVSRFQIGPSWGPITMGPSYDGYGADADQSDLHAIKYQLEKAETTGPMRGQDAYLEGQGAYYEGYKLTQNIYMVGPEDDKMAYLTVAFWAAMAARTIGSPQNAPVVAVAQSYFMNGLATKPFNVFWDDRSEILIEGLKKLQDALVSVGADPNRTYGVAILANSALESNLDWSTDQFSYLNLVVEQAGEMAEDAAKIASNIGKGLQNVTDPDKMGIWWEKHHRKVYIVGGMGLTIALLAVGAPYLRAIMAVVGDDD